MLRELTLLPVVLAAAIAGPAVSSADEMPKGFVYLRDIDPTIEQDMRYAGAKNFTGRPAAGYAAGECVLVRQAAEALKEVQADLKAKGLGLKVYDCYRPARAVAGFVAWTKEPDDPKAKAVYYPNVPKSELLPNYIAPRSGHSRGAAVDLTLVPLGGQAKEEPESAPCTAPAAPPSDCISTTSGTSPQRFFFPRLAQSSDSSPITELGVIG